MNPASSHQSPPVRLCVFLVEIQDIMEIQRQAILTTRVPCPTASVSKEVVISQDEATQNLAIPLSELFPDFCFCAHFLTVYWFHEDGGHVQLIFIEWIWLCVQQVGWAQSVLMDEWSPGRQEWACSLSRAGEQVFWRVISPKRRDWYPLLPFLLFYSFSPLVLLLLNSLFLVPP